jgi:hypothetical protein
LSVASPVYIEIVKSVNMESAFHTK